ncbi:MAG: ATP-binding protein [Bacteroidetes bacterium]|nr:MAG: ATP-binding protein [Bacteroidota bacterium]
MEIKQKEQITAAVNEWIDTNNPDRSGQKLSEKAGINISYISNIKNGSYFIGATPIKDEYFIKIAVAMGFKIEETELHFETENFKLVQNVCKSAQQKRKIVLLDSEESGLGKTYGLEHYATYNDKVLYIKCTSSMGAKDLLDEIIYKLSIKDAPKGAKAKIDAIRDKVLSTPGYLIIIDEAEDIKISLYKILKEIIDFTYMKCALVVSGMSLTNKIERLARKERPGFPQLKRRLFANQAKLRMITNKEKADICQAYNISAKSAIQWFQKQVHDYQMFAEYIKDVLDFVKKHPQTVVDEEFLRGLFSIA